MSTVVELRTHPSPHPIVRRSLVARAPEGLPQGSVVTLRAPDGAVLGDAFWNPRSDLTLRRLTDGDVRFDDAALGAALDAAIALRRDIGLGEDDDASAYRVVHAEGDGLSGLVVDRYRDVLGIELHAAGWLPLADRVAALLHERLGTRHHRIAMSSRVARLEGTTPVDRESEGMPRRVKVSEHGVRWHVDLARGHKTGFFCDQRQNRHAFADMVAGRDVLDVCCYSGGFAVTAAAVGDPASVTAVDLDEEAVAMARANAKLNQVRLGVTHADAFDWLRQMGRGGRRWGAVVLDPPKLVPSERDRDEGEMRYRDLNRLALEAVAPGGMFLTCTCSGLVSLTRFTELVRSAARRAGRRVTILTTTGAAPDHPVLLECPESEYLNALWCRVT